MDESAVALAVSTAKRAKAKVADSNASWPDQSRSDVLPELQPAGITRYASVTTRIERVGNQSWSGSPPGPPQLLLLLKEDLQRPLNTSFPE